MSAALRIAKKWKLSRVTSGPSSLLKTAGISSTWCSAKKTRTLSSFAASENSPQNLAEMFSSPMDAATPLANLDPTLRLNPKLANAKD